MRDNMKSTTMMYVDKILDIYTSDDSRLQAHIFQKIDANRKMHFGCRYYQNQIFQFDEFYPTKSLAYAESAALNWTTGVKKE